MALPLGYVNHLYHPIVNTDFSDDEGYSLSKRFSFYNPVTNPGILRLVDRTIKEFSARIGELEPWTQQRVLEHYNGGLRKRYERAAEYLRHEPFDVRVLSKIKCFVKREKWEQLKPPRTIMSREPPYTLKLSQFTKPLEHRMFALRDEYGLPIFAKGRNQKERHDIIRDKFDLFHNTRVVGIDCTKFDAHVTVQQLRWESRTYLRCFKNNSFLRSLLRAQERNTIRTKYGRRLVSHGKRMSGDANTGLGNCTIVYLIIKTWINQERLNGRVAIFCDGDDTLIFLPPHLYHHLTSLVALFTMAGHEMRVDKETDVFEEIVFCQSSPVGGTMVRNWRKVISHAYVSHKHYGEPKFGRQIMKSISQAELSLNRNIPILGPFFSEMLKHFTNDKITDQVLEYRFRSLLPRHWRNAVFEVPSQQTREEFAIAFGISPEEQIFIERDLCRLVASADYSGYSNGAVLPLLSVSVLNNPSI